MLPYDIDDSDCDLLHFKHTIIKNEKLKQIPLKFSVIRKSTIIHSYVNGDMVDFGIQYRSIHSFISV